MLDATSSLIRPVSSADYLRSRVCNLHFRMRFGRHGYRSLDYRVATRRSFFLAILIVIH
jgi:hypothetical protein